MSRIKKGKKTGSTKGKVMRGRKGKGQLKSLERGEESPNKHIKSNPVKYQIGIVEGRMGQTIGLEEIALSGATRKYSVICNSTQNKLIKINKQYF